MSDEPMPIQRLRAALLSLGLPEIELAALLEAVESGLRVGAIEQILTELSESELVSLQHALQAGADQGALLAWLRTSIPGLDELIRVQVSHQVETIVKKLEGFAALDALGCRAYLRALKAGEG